MTWEDLVSNAKKNNANLAKSQRSAGDITSKSTWEDLVYAATRTNVDILKEKQEEYKKTDEYKFAKENETRLRSGLGYNVNNGQIYSFEPLTKESLQKSISWADSEIEKLKKQGGTSNPLWDIVANIGNTGNDVRATAKGKEISDASERIKELEGKRAVYQKYLENLQVKEDVEKLDSDIFAKNKIGAIFNIDNEQKLYFLNAGEDGYDNDTYYNNSVKRDNLVKELQNMGYDDVDRYIESYAKSRNEETFTPILEYIEKGIVKHPVLGAAATTAINAVTAPIQGVGQAFDSIAEAAGIHGYSAASLPGMVSDLSKTTVHKVIDENIDNTFLNKLSKVAYNTATNIVENSFVNKTFDKLSEGVLGLNAATSTYKTGKERGLSDGQALANGIAAGIFETLFEHISLEKLRVFQASPSTTLKPFIKNVLKQSFAEGTEELFTDVANEAYDYFVNGGLSEYEQALRSGATSKEYGQQFLAQLGETFITGALAGGGMIGVSAAPTAVMGSVAQNSADRKNGSKIRSEGEVEKLFNEAKGQGGSVGRNAAKLEKRIADGKKVSDRKIGQLDRKTTKAERERAVDGILSSADYKEVSGKEKRAIRSSVLTYLSTGGEVSYEQKQVLDTENGTKVLEAAQKWEIDKVLKIGSERAERRSTNIKKALDEGNTESLVKNTFSAVNAEGHKVNVGAVRSITDGEFEVVQDTETGATVKLSELKIDDRQAMELYRNLQELATGENPLTVDAVNVALSMYNTLDNTSARAYSLWVHDAYKAGALNIKDTVLSFSEFEEMFRNKYKADITKEQLREFYEIGARNLKVKPGVTRIGRKGLSKFQAEQVFILHERAKALGLEIVLTDGQLSDENGKDINALYVEGTNRIVMSLKSDLNLVLVHAGHEIFHWAKNQNREGGAFLQDMVINVLKADSKYDFDGIYKQVSAEYEGLSEEDMLEEIAAQYLGVVFANEDGIRKTVAAATAKQRSFLKKMVDYLRDFIKSLKKLIDLYGDSDKAVRAAVETPVDQLQYIADTFEEILKKTAEIKKPAESDGGVKASLSKTELSDVQSIADRKSVNEFSSSDIEKTKVLAKIFYKDIKEKSPFFRAWFGDWREYDTTPVTIANKKGSNKAPINNKDTGWDIQISGKVFTETRTHRAAATRAAVKYLAYIDSIVENAVLLDTFSIGEKKSENSLLMHSFYSVADIGNGPEVLKLYVEEMNNPNTEKTSKRTYKLLNIEKASAASARVQISPSSVTSTANAIHTVSDLFKVVKSKDNSFNPNPVNPAFLNEDGTPKVYYHGTNATWTEYDLSKNVNQMWGEGIYLTPDYNRAKLYGDNVMPFYVRALVNNRTAKKTGQKKDHTIMKNGDVLVYSPEQIKSVTDNVGTFDKTKKDIRYSYAGVKAKTADIKTLDYAARLEDVGKATSEEIRQQTGWFRGYDNKWRFEISDRDMEIDTRGLFSMNPDIRRYTQLVDKAYFDMTATEEELQELVALEKNLEGVSVEPKTLGGLIHHPALFEAYPQLKDIKVYFDDIEPRGAYNPVFNEITLQKKLKLDKAKLAKTLVHEIQHAVQEIEGFAGGASTSYWEAVYRDEYITLEGMKENLDMWLREIGFTEYVQKSMQQVISKEKTMAQHWEDLESFKQNSRYAREIASCENAIEEFKKTLPDPADLYERTAGEIEARDAALRHWRTDEARKEKRPDIDRTDVVFAEGASKAYDYVGKTADGIEIYETSDNIKGLSYKQKLEIFKENFYKEDSPHYLGRKIAFQHDGKTDYAEIDRFTQKENIEKINPKHLNQWDKAKINVGASGDFVTLLEKARYDSQSRNTDFTKNDAHKKTGVFEYYLKSVYVDSKPYDVVINIRKEFSGERFVYEVKFKNNKELSRHEPQIVEDNRRPKVQSTRLLENSKKSLTQRDTDVKKKYSRQLLNDTWYDIRDKMYENEIHEDIIGEIEAYIKKLTTRKLARETAVTEGLIPKYDAILKVAREYTKGSDVSAQQLADTINDLMWAANDGNLDTKQFISTVKLIAEDIIRTGSKINEDMYREYAEFRSMTRAETVYVERRVYNQYVEEYGSVKELNRACAGKIKIKPYEDGNKTGRSLDDFYGELQEAFPGLLPEDADVYHQIYEILYAWQKIQPTTEYFSDMLGIKTDADLQHQSLVLAEDILSEVLGIKETVKTIADKYSDKLKYHQEHYKEYYRKQAEEGRRRRRESEEISVLNKRILRNTNRLSDMIRNETDERHIPEDFKEAVMGFLNIFISKNDEGRDVYHIKNGVLDMVKLGNAYASYYNPVGEEGREMTHYDEDVAGWINELAVVFGDEIDIKTLSLENLKKVDNIVTHFCHIIKHENEMFVSGRKEKFSDWAISSINEMLQHTKKPEYEAEKIILDAEYGMLTPIYFFKTIGTTTENGRIFEERLFKMFRDLQDGQDKWYRNISDTKKRLSEIKEKYHYSEGWKRDTTEFTLASGEKIKLTAEEIMYMRALNIRETGHINRLCHLLEGGIIVENDGRLRSFAEKKQSASETKAARKDFEKKGRFTESDIKDALKRDITEGDLIMLFATLTEEQEQYSEALVEMLSTTGAELGNEVSRELVGIRKFTEKNYIPISVAESFLQFSVDKKSGGTVRLKNRSFTKRTTQNANATVYVRSITDIAAEHMQEMSLYNAMTIPIENLTRVFNYQKPVQEEFTEEGKLQKNTGNSYKEIFEAVYGKRGVKYFEDFLRDMNGGNQMQSRDFMSKMMSMFKKSAVTGSLSVAIQQPSAIVRATALIDPKYFVAKPYSKEDYLEMLEYCPVAGIKEIGRFDTGTGLTATEWILDENGGIKEKADALLSYLPGWMDRRTWVYIWEAVKKETADKTKLKGEELLEESAKRFRDVIDYTQVYDSTLSRSAYMRDKGTGAKMATAFLSEPTLSYNMVRDGLLNAKNDKKQAARSVAAFAGATLLNAMLKTLVTALRHDDEETNYFEVYLSEMPQNFVEDLIIVNSLPVVKDIISIFKGYDVNRSDMTLFSNLYNAFKVISKEDHVPTWDEWFSLIGAVSAFTGIPLNNILKDLTAITKTVIGIGRSPEFSWDVLGQTITETFIGKEDDSVKLYRAIINGNKEIIDRYLEVDEKKVQEYKSQGYSDADALNKAMDNAENSFHSKVVSGLVSEDIRIKEAAEARLDAETEAYEELLAELTGLGFDKNDVIKAVEKYISSMEDKTYTQSKSTDLAEYSYEDLFNAINAKDMTSAEHIFDKLSEKVSKDTVRGNIREEYAEEMYKSILNKNKTEKQHLIDMFEKFREDWHYAATLGLRENDLRVFEAAEARYSGDTAAYERLKADIVADGFDENDVFNAIEVETEKLAPAEEDKESHPEDSYLYEAADLKRYAKEYKLEATKQAIKNFRDSGKKDGKIRESLNDVFKPMYIEAWQSGNHTVIETIRVFLAALDVGYTEKIFSGWEKEANEK